jgi:hypothetical protein
MGSSKEPTMAHECRLGEEAWAAMDVLAIAADGT